MKFRSNFYAFCSFFRLCTLGVSPSFYQGIVKTTVSGVLDALNGCCPVFALLAVSASQYLVTLKSKKNPESPNVHTLVSRINAWSLNLKYTLHFAISLFEAISVDFRFVEPLGLNGCPGKAQMDLPLKSKKTIFKTRKNTSQLY